MAMHIVVGECMVEMSGRAEHLYYQKYAGDTYNTAVYLKRCNPNLDVAYWTAAGTDPLSQGFLDSLVQEQLDPSLVLRQKDKTLGLYLINTDCKGERSFAYWRSDSAARQLLGVLHEQTARNIVDQASSLFFSGISLAILSDDNRKQFLQKVTELKERGCRIIFDPNYRPKLWQSVEHARDYTDKAYQLATIAFPGCDDHKTLYGQADLDAVKHHVQALGVEEIVIKNGEHGVQIFSGSQHYIEPAYVVKQVVDTTAAGDAFNGGYLAARLAGQNEQRSARFGAKLAAFVIGHRGAIVEKATMADFLTLNRIV